MNFLTGALFEVASRSASPARELTLFMDIPNQQSCSTGAASLADDSLSGSDGDDDSEHTFEAFGDISLTNAYFVPGAPSEISPVRDPIKRGKIQRPLPPSILRLPALMKDQPLPAVAVTPGPSKESAFDDDDFDFVVANRDAQRLNLEQTIAPPANVKRKAGSAPRGSREARPPTGRDSHRAGEGQNALRDSRNCYGSVPLGLKTT